jgi:hypothetical protein
MHTLNHTLEDSLLDADGRYLNARELSSLEHYMQSYAARLNAYHQLRDQSEHLIKQALRKLAQEYPDLIRQHGQRCIYDMTEVVRYMAVSILRDDEVFFKEQMMSWLDTILVAHRKTVHCTKAYQNLQAAIVDTLPAPTSNLIRPFLEIVITMLQSHA